MVVFVEDANAILTACMKNRSESELIRGYYALHKYFCKWGFDPSLQFLNNECSTCLKTLMKDKQVNFQLVPPHYHQTNPAKKAIGTWKYYFIAGLCIANPKFPSHLWNCLVEQCTTTLNLLRRSKTNTKISAKAHFNGAFDYHRTPMAPPGTKVLVHENPQNRCTWYPHSVEGWYVGHDPEH